MNSFQIQLTLRLILRRGCLRGAFQISHKRLETWVSQIENDRQKPLDSANSGPSSLQIEHRLTRSAFPNLSAHLCDGTGQTSSYRVTTGSNSLVNAASVWGFCVWIVVKVPAISILPVWMEQETNLFRPQTLIRIISRRKTKAISKPIQSKKQKPFVWFE